MPRTTSFQLSEEMDAFIEHQVQRGVHKSASEVVRTALSRYIEDEQRTSDLNAMLDRALMSPRAEPGVFARVRARHGIGR
jgi:putative addiction module CopG family antidote